MSQKRKLSPPPCDQCGQFLYGPSCSGSQMVCEACAIVGGLNATPIPTLATWMESSFPEEWTRKKATVTEDVCTALESKGIHVELTDVPDKHRTQIIQQVVQFKEHPTSIQVVDTGAPEDLSSLYWTIEMSTKEVPTITKVAGFISVFGGTEWKTLVLVHPILQIPPVNH